MEPNKLENQIREKLNSREIQPSAQDWDRLDAMLSVAEEKKTKRPFGILSRNFGVAASIMVLLTVGLFFFTQKSTQINTQKEIVTKDTVQKEINKSQIPVVEKNKENQVAAINKSQPINQKSAIVNQQSTISNQQATISNQRVSINNQKQSKNPNINHDKEIEYQINRDIAQKDLPRIVNQKTSAIKNEETAKLDDFLLASLNSAGKKNSVKQSAIKVDAKSLLSQVDGELELNFREKVINKVSKNYEEIKVALANRNNE
jgi:hypothetical protein